MFLLLIDANHIFENTWRTSLQSGRLSADAFFERCLASVDRALSEHKPSHVLFAISDSAQSIRKENNPEYRFGQWVLPESYRVKMFSFRQELKKRGCSFTSHPGFESRDIIATIASKIKADVSVSVGILGVNKAYLPVISDQVIMINHYAKFPDERITSKEDLVEKFGFSGSKILDVLVLEGDSEQNIKGAHGIGRKKARELVNKFGSLSGINASIDEVSKSLRQNVTSFFKSDARSSYLMWRNVDKLNLGIKFNQLRYNQNNDVVLAKSFTDGSFEKIG